jgi:hypothetical protein
VRKVLASNYAQIDFSSCALLCVNDESEKNNSATLSSVREQNVEDIIAQNILQKIG